jgi:transposase
MATMSALILPDLRHGMTLDKMLDRGQRMWALRRKGHSARWIAARFKVDVRTVQRWVSRFDEAEGNLVDKGLIDAMAKLESSASAPSST